MKTQIEIFEVEEIKYETVEQSAEAKALIESLGLEGQKQKTVEANTSTLTRFPYRLMTNEELFIYGQLCPQKEDATRYTDEPIPLEVLKTMAYAKSLNDPRIQCFDIWAAATSKVKDPILLGKDSRYSSKYYILARWGAELMPLEVLLPDALKLWYAARVDKINEHIATLKTELLKPCPQSVPTGRNDPYLSL